MTAETSESRRFFESSVDADPSVRQQTVTHCSTGHVECNVARYFGIRKSACATSVLIILWKTYMCAVKITKVWISDNWWLGPAPAWTRYITVHILHTVFSTASWQQEIWWNIFHHGCGVGVRHCCNVVESCLHKNNTNNVQHTGCDCRLAA